MASRLPGGQRISHSHPSWGILPSAAAAKNAVSPAWNSGCFGRVTNWPILSEDFTEADCLTRRERLMVAGNPNNRLPSAGPDPVQPATRLAQRVRHYLDPHSE